MILFRQLTLSQVKALEVLCLQGEGDVAPHFFVVLVQFFSNPILHTGNMLALKISLLSSFPSCCATVYIVPYKTQHIFTLQDLSQCGGSSLRCYANCRYPWQRLTPTPISSSCSYLLIRPPPPHPPKKTNTPPSASHSASCLRPSLLLTYAGFQCSLSRCYHTCCWVPVIPCSRGRG